MKKNNNMLISRLYPGILGGTAPSTNTGKFMAKGYDGSLTWRDTGWIQCSIEWLSVKLYIWVSLYGKDSDR